MIKKMLIISRCLILLIIIAAYAGCNKSKEVPLRIVAELNIGESKEIKLPNRDIVKLSLLGIQTVCDSIRNAIHEVKVRISVNGEEITIGSGNYNLPVTVGEVQIDCPIVKNYYINSDWDVWKLKKDARFRLWLKDYPYLSPGTFVYPVKQRWFADKTQSGNEPTFSSFGLNPENKKIYYHSGHDIGGAEGLDEILSATDGLVVSANGDALEGYSDLPGNPRFDRVHIKDNRDWYYMYSHLDSIFPTLKPGIKVKPGQRIGLMGKKGDSGGWVHLHFDISIKDTTTGNWVREDAYPYLWEAYVRQYDPAVIAVARPQQQLWTGQVTRLDGRKSKSLKGEIVSYEWIFCDGTTAVGAVQEKSYEKPGEYCEILKVTDSKGNLDYDFTTVKVIDKNNPEKFIPGIQAAYYPTLNIKPGDPVTFLVRTFNSDVDNEVWDFGDGSPKIKTKSEKVIREKRTEGKFAETRHSYSKAGNYIVRVERSNENGYKAIGHLHVVVNE
ncbi:PKD domain-containing protein [Bacteroidota bacterium]